MRSALEEAKRREADLQLRFETSERASAEQASVLMKEKDDLAAKLSAVETPPDVAELSQLLLSKTDDLDKLRERLDQSEKSRVNVSRLSEALHNQLTSARLTHEAELAEKAEAEALTADHKQENAELQERLAQLEVELGDAKRQAEMRQLSALLPTAPSAQPLLPVPLSLPPSLASLMPGGGTHSLSGPRVTPTITPVVDRTGLHSYPQASTTHPPPSPFVFTSTRPSFSNAPASTPPPDDPHGRFNNGGGGRGASNGHGVKVDVPAEPKIRSHPEGDDAYSPMIMGKYAADVMSDLTSQRWWGFWLNTEMTPEIEQNSHCEQFAANTVATHVMLHAAVFKAIPDTPANAEIRRHVADSCVVQGCTLPDGVRALTAMLSRNVSYANGDVDRVQCAIAFITGCGVPIPSGTTVAEFHAREGKLDKLFNDSGGLVTLPPHQRAVMLRVAFPLEHKTRITEVFADCVRSQGGSITDYARFRYAASAELASARRDESLRDLGSRLSDLASASSPSSLARRAIASPTATPVIDEPTTLSPAPHVAKRPPSPSGPTHDEATADDTTLCTSMCCPAVGAEIAQSVDFAACCGQTWALAARSMDKSAKCKVCGLTGHGMGSDEYHNTMCYSSVDGPGPDNEALDKFSDRAKIAVLKRSAQVLRKFLASMADRRHSGAPSKAAAKTATLSSEPPGVHLDAPAIPDSDALTDLDDDEQFFRHPDEMAVYPAVARVSTPLSQASSDTSHEAAGPSDLETVDSSDSQMGSPGLLQSFDSLSSDEELSDEELSTPSPAVNGDMQIAGSTSTTTRLARDACVLPKSAPHDAAHLVDDDAVSHVSPPSADDDVDMFSAAGPILCDMAVTEINGVDQLSSLPGQQWYVVRNGASLAQSARFYRRLLCGLRLVSDRLCSLATIVGARTLGFTILFLLLLPAIRLTHDFSCGVQPFPSNANDTVSSLALSLPPVAPGSPLVVPTCATVRSFLDNHESLTTLGSATDVCFAAICIALLQFWTAWRAACAAAVVGAESRPERAFVHECLHFRYLRIREKLLSCIDAAFFYCSIALICCLTFARRLLNAVAVSMMWLGPLAAALLVVDCSAHSPPTWSGVTSVTGPPIVARGYDGSDLFVYKMHAKPSVGGRLGLPLPKMTLPSKLAHAQQEFDDVLRRGERHSGLNDTGCSYDCYTDKRAFPVINGVSSCQAPPSNALISGAEGDVTPPEGYGIAQTVWTDDRTVDYIKTSPQSWYTPSFERTLFSESSMGFFCHALSQFYFGRQVVFPNATIPMRLNQRVYEIGFRYLDQTDYLPVPHGAAVPGLWLAREKQSPLPPRSQVPIASGSVNSWVAAAAATRGRGTTFDRQTDYKIQHNLCHSSPRVLSKWHKVAKGVGKLPENLAECCDACLFADGTSFAGLHSSPEPATDGAWCLDSLCNLPESLYGKYRYAHIAANRTTKRYFFYPTRTRDEMPAVRQALIAHCKKTGMAFDELTTDGAGEMVSKDAIAFLLGHAAGLNIGCAHEHNNKHAERAILRLCRMARSFTCHAFDDDDAALMWPEAFACATEVHNTLPCKVGTVWTSPTLLAGLDRPDVSSLRVPFCDARILLQGPATQSKVLPKRVHALYTGPCVLGIHRGWSFITSTRCEKAFSHEGIFKESHFSGLASVRSGTRRKALAPAAPDDGSDDSTVSDDDDVARPVRQRNPPTRFAEITAPPPDPPSASVPRQPRVRSRRLVPASVWPDYVCTENGGAGWTVEIVRASNSAGIHKSFIHFLDAQLPDGSRFGDEWILSSALADLPAADVASSVPEPAPAPTTVSSSVPTPSPSADPVPAATPPKGSHHARHSRGQSSCLSHCRPWFCLAWSLPRAA